MRRRVTRGGAAMPRDGDGATDGRATRAAFGTFLRDDARRRDGGATTTTTRAMMFRRGARMRAVALCVVLATRLAMPAYDASRGLARASTTRRDATRRGGLADVACEGVRAATSWDGEHHVGIAVRGYEFEHQHAFYPGLAMATRATTAAVGRAARLAGARTTRDDAREECAAGAAAMAINAYAFARSVEAMYALSTQLLRDEALAEAAATLYAMNPANVFYGSAYAEAGFAYAQFAAGSLLQENKVLHSGVVFGVATMFRSNGVLCVVLLLGHAGREMFRLLRDANDETRHRRAARHLKRAMIAIALTVAPHYAFAHFGDMRYCNGAVFDGAERPYCRPKSWRNLYGYVPSGMYSFIQRHYWNLGFMSSYRARNLGNVLLGAPAIALGFYLTKRFAWSRDARVFVKEEQRFFVGAYFVKLGVMTVIAATYMHVQVATRFLSTSPAMYWGLAHLGRHSKAWRRFIATYHVSYALVGAALFANFYPWT